MQLRINVDLQNGKYRILRVLGQGGFGITYLAEHTMLDKMVAIKEFFPREYCDRDENTSHLTIGTKNSIEIVEMLKGKFIKEAKNISKLRHPNIITIHDIFQENNTAYYVMEYVEGVSLSQIVKQKGALSEANAIGYIRKVADAVGYMHSLSMNHLDIKPANIMVRSMDDEPILIDFGLSKQYDASGGQTSTTPIGISHGFAPIEQYRPGGVATFTPQTDIYALGATLFNLISGSVPPHYSEILEDGLPELPSAVSKKCIDAIKHAMEVRKNRRPASVSEFIDSLSIELYDNKSDQSNECIITKPKSNFSEEQISDDLCVPKKEHIENKQVIENKKPKLNSFSEETVILNVPLLDSIKPSLVIPSELYINSKEVSNKMHQHSELEYLDLGLSVKWATKLSGFAKPKMNDDVYAFHLYNGNVIRPIEFIKNNKLPSFRHFVELIERCRWTTFSENDLHGYKIVGPNGNILMMPLGILNHYLTLECINSFRMYYYFLYLGEYTHTLAKGAPVEANIWTIKDV